MFSRVNLSTGAMASGCRCAFADGNPSSTLVGPVGSLVGESLRNLARDLETLAAGGRRSRHLRPGRCRLPDHRLRRGRLVLARILASASIGALTGVIIANVADRVGSPRSPPRYTRLGKGSS